MPGRRLLSARKRRTMKVAETENVDLSNHSNTSKSVRKTGRKRRSAKSSRTSGRGRKAAGGGAAGNSSTNLAATIDAVETKLFTSRSSAEKALDDAYAEHDNYLQQWFLATKKRLLDNMHVDEPSRKSLKTDNDASPGQSEEASASDKTVASAAEIKPETAQETTAVGEKRKSRSSELSQDAATSAPAAEATGASSSASVSQDAVPDRKRQRLSSGNEADSSAPDTQAHLLAIEDKVGRMLVKELRAELQARNVEKRQLRQRKSKLAALLQKMLKEEYLESLSDASDSTDLSASVDTSVQELPVETVVTDESTTTSSAADHTNNNCDDVVVESIVEPVSSTEDPTPTDATPEVEADVGPEVEAEAEVQPSTEAEAEAGLEVEVQPSTESEVEAEAEVEANANHEVEAEAEAEVAPEVEPEAEAEVEAEAAPEVEPEAAPEVEPEAGPKAEPEEQPMETSEESFNVEEETVSEDADNEPLGADAEAEAVTVPLQDKEHTAQTHVEVSGTTVEAETNNSKDLDDEESAVQPEETSAEVVEEQENEVDAAAVPEAEAETEMEVESGVAKADGAMPETARASLVAAETEPSNSPSVQATEATADATPEVESTASIAPELEAPTSMPVEEPAAATIAPAPETSSVADDLPAVSLHGQSLFQDKMLRMMQKTKTTPNSSTSAPAPADDPSATQVSESPEQAAVEVSPPAVLATEAPSNAASDAVDMESSDVKTNEIEVSQQPAEEHSSESSSAAPVDVAAAPTAHDVPTAPVPQAGLPLPLAPVGVKANMGELAAAAAALAARKAAHVSPATKSLDAAEVPVAPEEPVNNTETPAAKEDEFEAEVLPAKAQPLPDATAASVEDGDAEMRDTSDDPGEDGDIDLDEVEKLGQKMRDEIRARLKRRLAGKEKQSVPAKGSGVDTVLAPMDSDATATPYSSDSAKTHESSVGATQDTATVPPASAKSQRSERATDVANSHLTHKTPRAPATPAASAAVALSTSNSTSNTEEDAASASESSSEASSSSLAPASSTRSMKQPPMKVAVAAPTSSTKSRARLNYKEIWKKAQAEAAEQVKLSTPSAAARAEKSMPAGREDKPRRGGRLVKPSDKNEAAGSFAAPKVIRGGGKARQKVAALEAGKKARQAQERKEQQNARKRDETDLKRALRVLAHLRKRGEEPPRVGDWAQVKVTSSTSSTKSVVYVNMVSRELSRTKPSGWDASRREQSSDDSHRRKLKKQALQTYTINRRTQTSMVRVGDWYEVSVGSGTYAYVNRKTKQATLTKPSRWDDIRKRRLVAEVLREFDVRRSRSIEMDEVDGWFMLLLSNPSRGPFYVNDSTRKVTQKKPPRWDEEMRSRRKVLEEFERSISSKSHTMDQVDGWYEVFVALGTNSTGTLTRAYVHRQSRKIVWQKPSGWDQALMRAKQQRDARHAEKQRAMQPPEWVQSENLARALQRQHAEQRDPELIFGSIPAPVDMEAIFENSSSRKRAKWQSRGDSAQWLPVTTQEKQDCLQAKVELAHGNQDTKYDTSEGSGNSSSESSGDDSDYESDNE